MVTLRSLEDIRQFSRLPFSLRRYAGPVFLAIDSMPQGEVGPWERRLTKYYTECGCTLGAVFTFVGIGADLPLLLLGARSGWGLWGIPAVVGAALAIPLFAALMGKVLGISLGRIRLRLAAQTLITRLSQRNL